LNTDDRNKYKRYQKTILKNKTYGMTKNKMSLHILKVSKKRRKSRQETEMERL
jgi:hypothetical protein